MQSLQMDTSQSWVTIERRDLGHSSEEEEVEPDSPEFISGSDKLWLFSPHVIATAISTEPGSRCNRRRVLPDGNNTDLFTTTVPEADDSVSSLQNMVQYADAGASLLMPSWDTMLPDTFWEEVALLLQPLDLFFLTITSSTMLNLLRSYSFLQVYCELWQVCTCTRCFALMRSKWHQHVHYRYAHTGLISRSETITYLRILDDLIDEWGMVFCHFDVNEWSVPQRIRELDWVELNGDFRLLFSIWRDEDWTLWNQYLEYTDYPNILFTYDEQNKGWEATTLADLSPSLLRHVFCFLPFRDVVKLQAVCHKFNNLTKQTTFTTAYIARRGETDCVICSFCQQLFATASHLQVRHRYAHVKDITDHEHRVYMRMLNTYHFTNDMDDYCCTPTIWEYIFTFQDEAMSFYEDFSQPAVTIAQHFDNLRMVWGDNDWKRFQIHLQEEINDYKQRELEQALTQDKLNHIGDLSAYQMDPQDLQDARSSWNSLSDYMSDD